METQVQQKTYQDCYISEAVGALLPDGMEEGEARAIRVPDIRRALLQALRRVEAGEYFFALFVDWQEVPAVEQFLRGFDQQRIYWGMVVFRVPEEKAAVLAQESRIAAVRSAPLDRGEMVFLREKILKGLYREVREKEKTSKSMMNLLDTRNDQDALISIGKSLTAEKDPDKLLRSILFMSKKITGADAGSIFLVEEGNQGEKLLRFRYSHTFSKELDYEEFTMPCNTESISGYVAETGNVLNLPDVYNLPDDAPVSFNNSFDQTHGYRSRSMLVVPMRNHVDEIIGVIQLINSKESSVNRGRYTGNEAYEVFLETPEDFDKKVVPFDQRYESLMESVAGQAAVALENTRMMKQIETQFQEFVKASVGAIESRDPATSGHSFRVAEMCLALAREVNTVQTGPLAQWRFTESQMKELEFAALLHDFGKVYIDEAIFQKAKKLYARDYDNLKLRLSFLLRSLELDSCAEGCRQGETDSRIEELKEIMGLVDTLNEPKIFVDNLDEQVDGILARQEELLARDLEGKPIPLLTEEEEENLRIRKGSLNGRERTIIESHVEHTYSFVSKIPWPQEFSRIPDIARQHHEMLNGAGYPRGLEGEDILPQGRMMAIADIFDALSAADRPYKKAVPLSKVLEILREEAARGKLDSDLVELLIERKLYEEVGKGNDGESGKESREDRDGADG